MNRLLERFGFAGTLRRASNAVHIRGVVGLRHHAARPYSSAARMADKPSEPRLQDRVRLCAECGIRLNVENRTRFCGPTDNPTCYRVRSAQRMSPLRRHIETARFAEERQHINVTLAKSIIEQVDTVLLRMGIGRANRSATIDGVMTWALKNARSHPEKFTMRLKQSKRSTGARRKLALQLTSSTVEKLGTLCITLNMRRPQIITTLLTWAVRQAKKEIAPVKASDSAPSPHDSAR